MIRVKLRTTPKLSSPGSFTPHATEVDDERLLLLPAGIALKVSTACRMGDFQFLKEQTFPEQFRCRSLGSLAQAGLSAGVEAEEHTQHVGHRSHRYSAECL